MHKAHVGTTIMYDVGRALKILHDKMHVHPPYVNYNNGKQPLQETTNYKTQPSYFSQKYDM
jgi:hypothetical protein